MKPLGAGDLLAIAEAVLGEPAEDLLLVLDLGLADSALNAPFASFAGIEFHPSLYDKAAVLCGRLANNHPLPNGNKRVAYECMVEFLARNGRAWRNPAPKEAADAVVALVTGEMSEDQFAAWVKRHTEDPPSKSLQIPQKKDRTFPLRGRAA